MRVLLTGITGFAGSHLAEYILNHHPEVEVFGLIRWRSRRENIVHLENEFSGKYTISKATAKGAITSIFTISNDF